MTGSRKKILTILIFFQLSLLNYGQVIIDHKTATLEGIPAEWISQARSVLHIAYEHTSHGSQLIDGMTGLYNWKGSTYAWNNGGTGGALDIDDQGITGGTDLGSPDWTSWAASTRTYLNNPSNSNVNVVMWSWCSQVSTATESNINTYLSLMSDLERDYPNVRFVYMTGHLDGTGLNGNLHQRNQQIRSYCLANNKILYDFADIESYNPDGDYFLDKGANDNCDYDSDGNGSPDKNWAIDWQNSHTENVDWYSCPASHSQPLNANLKAYAAWWLWARLAGWSGNSSPRSVTTITVTGSGGSDAITLPGGTLQLHAEVLPSDADNKTVTWSVTNDTGRASIASNGLLTAIENGTVVVRAAATDGSGIYGELTVYLSGQTVPVENITITTENGSNIIPDRKGDLQLSAHIIPQTASSKNVTWSIENITGEAVVNSSGLVTALNEGIVKVTASATDGSGVKSHISIRIMNSDPLVIITGEYEMKILLEEDYTGCKLSLFNLNGALLDTLIVEGDQCIVDISPYPAGIYILTLSNSMILKTGKAIIH